MMGVVLGLYEYLRGKSDKLNVHRFYSAEKLCREQGILLLDVSRHRQEMRKTLSHTSLRYSPASACLNMTIPVGSSLRASAVERAVMPKPYCSL